jgi:hypothetical protein
MEAIMDDRNQEARTRIAAEAVGERLEGARDEKGMSAEDTMRRNAVSPGPRASIPEKTAEAVGERVGDAYADPGAAERSTRRNGGRPWQSQSQASGATDPVLAAVRQVAQIVTQRFEEQPLMLAGACFALGYLTAILLHGRR